MQTPEAPSPRPGPTPTPTPAPAPRMPAPTDPRPMPPEVPLSSIVVEDIGPVTPDTGVADVLLGSIALVGAMLLGSLLLGAVVGVLLVYVKHRLGFGGPDTDREDHVSLSIGRDEPRPPDAH